MGSLRFLGVGIGGCQDFGFLFGAVTYRGYIGATTQTFGRIRQGRTPILDSRDAMV